MSIKITNPLLFKSLIGLSLAGGGGLWVLDAYVDVDMMQQASADNVAANGQVLDENGNPVLLAQTVRGRVGLEPVQLRPGNGIAEEAEDDSEELKPLAPAAKPSTLTLPEINLLEEESSEETRDEAMEAEVESPVRNNGANLQEKTLEELINEIRAGRVGGAEPQPSESDSEYGPGQRRKLNALGEGKPLSLGPSRLEAKHPDNALPAPIKLPNEKELACFQELNVYEARLIAREKALLQAYETLQAEKERILQMEALVEDKWNVAREDWNMASALVTRSEEVCNGAPPRDGAGPPLNLGLQTVDPELRVNQVVQIVKGMKPKAAAKVIAQWDSPLAATALKRLSPRISSKILAELPKDMAQALTVDLVRGKEHRYESKEPVVQ